MRAFVIFGLLAGLGTQVAAEMKWENRFFTMGHGGMIRTRLDPIINPNVISGHVHSVVGTSSFGADLDFDKAQEGSCTTAPIQADKSAYWMPQLYYKYKNGTYYAISGDGLVTYWKFAHKFKNETFAVVPDDFRMLGGNITRDYFDKNQPSHDAVSFECFGENTQDERLGWIPIDRECPNIRPQVFFPNCWNGKDSYLPDNSHVTYAHDWFEGGACPSGFVRIPSLFLEAFYHVKDVVPDYEWYPGCLVLANGDNNGFSLHADWQNGWPSGMLVDAYNICGAEGKLPGTADGCSVLEDSKDQDKASACVTEGQVINEAIGLDKPLQYLPGNNMEFNSSRASPNHAKGQRPGYIDTAQIVTVPADLSGACEFIAGQKICHDYAGGGGPIAGEDIVDTDPKTTSNSTSTPKASISTGMGTGSSSSAPAPSGQVLIQTGEAATITVTVTASDCACSEGTTLHMRKRSRHRD